MEKINRAERERRKKEETRRIRYFCNKASELYFLKKFRKLVDLAYAKDPRIAQFKKDDQDEKERVKEGKRKAKLAKQVRLS